MNKISGIFIKPGNKKKGSVLTLTSNRSAEFITPLYIKNFKFNIHPFLENITPRISLGTSNLVLKGCNFTPNTKIIISEGLINSIIIKSPKCIEINYTSNVLGNKSIILSNGPFKNIYPDDKNKFQVLTYLSAPILDESQLITNYKADINNLGLLGDKVVLWDAKIQANQNNTNLSPIFNPTGLNGYPTLSFNHSKLDIANNVNINTNTNTYSERQIFLIFKTGNDITSRQVMYEEGGGINGINFYIFEKNVYCGLWNKSTGYNGKWFNSEINKNSAYVVELRFNNVNLSGYLNNISIGTASTNTNLSSHPGKIGIGSSPDGTLFPDGYKTSGHFFNGCISEILMFNKIQSNINDIYKYISEFWNISFNEISLN